MNLAERAHVKSRTSIGYLIFEKSGANKVEDWILADFNYSIESMLQLKCQAYIGRSLKLWLVQLEQVKTWLDAINQLSLSYARTTYHTKWQIGNQIYDVTTSLEGENRLVVHFASGMKEEPNYLNSSNLDEFEVIFNHTNEALFLVKEQGETFHYICNNLMHQVLTGYATNDIHGKSPTDILGDDVGNRHEINFRQCIESGQKVSFQESIVFKNQRKVYMTSLSPVYVAKQGHYIVGSRVDITQLDNKIREKDALLDKFVAMFNDHTAVMLLIEPYSGQIVDANKAAREFYGYSYHELKTMNIQEINLLSKHEVERMRLKAFESSQKYFLFPHKLKSGELKFVDVHSCPVRFGSQEYLYSIIFDVTDREMSKHELFKEKEFLNITLNSIGDGVITTDMEGRITRINPAAQSIVGWAGEEVLGRLFSDIFVMKNELTDMQSPCIIDYVLKTGRIQELANHTVILTKDGKYVPIADSAAPITNENGGIQGAVMVFRDITEEKEKKDRILYLSYHDTVTGLFNRRFYEDEVVKMDAQKSYPIAVIMGDVDGLKMTNDVFGHEVGDQLLRSIAAVMMDSISSIDVAIRWGGDEFVIIMPHTDERGAETFLERLKLSLDNRSINSVIKTSISFGYAIKKDNSEDLAAVVQRAEEMMYRLKLLESKSLRNNIMNAMLTTLYERSTETKEHADRLEDYCLAIGKQLKLRTEAMGELALFAMLHDIGKIGVDQLVLQKPGKLDAAEWVEMKRHPEIGYRITQSIPELSGVSEFILHHHERWDGLGYPSGISGKDIPLHCRILAVADAFDAMINDRIYRKAMSVEAALEEIKRHAGTQFDPDIVSIFLSLKGNLCY